MLPIEIALFGKQIFILYKVLHSQYSLLINERSKLFFGGTLFRICRLVGIESLVEILSNRNKENNQQNRDKNKVSYIWVQVNLVHYKIKITKESSSLFERRPSLAPLQAVFCTIYWSNQQTGLCFLIADSLCWKPQFLLSEKCLRKSHQHTHFIARI